MKNMQKNMYMLSWRGIANMRSLNINKMSHVYHGKKAILAVISKLFSGG